MTGLNRHMVHTGSRIRQVAIMTGGHTHVLRDVTKDEDIGVRVMRFCRSLCALTGVFIATERHCRDNTLLSSPSFYLVPTGRAMLINHANLLVQAGSDFSSFISLSTTKAVLHANSCTVDGRDELFLISEKR